MNSGDIKKLIEDLLKQMQITFESIEVTESDGRERFSVKTPDSHILIGAKGAHLLAFNHLVKKIVAAKGERARLAGASSHTLPKLPATERIAQEKTFFVDVNGYQEGMLEDIKNVAKVMGERARSFKSSVELEPMSSYERMIVHSFFQEAKDIKTESVGEGERRRVVIKYVEQTTDNP